ncbi:hypothetical protein NEOLEDRAFT_1181683 [Neolentinus lepideus HHB14362 ss-1]|uniref:Uncharacterized protein n=1 Tax=Neolentinus lepideus HHB14362 ss-1 TaxID=1314782 RepID=A0A165PUH3_9AGAM|nr:hypothetical protein NEOLEDRAFT_1181683 [Neolentinus lepideus HHB14362 ss-1]
MQIEAVAMGTIDTGIDTGEHENAPGMLTPNFGFPPQSVYDELHHFTQQTTNLAEEHIAVHGTCAAMPASGHFTPLHAGTSQSKYSNEGRKPIYKVPRFTPPRMACRPQYPCYNNQPQLPPHQYQTMQEHTSVNLHFTQHNGTYQPGIWSLDAYQQWIPPVVMDEGTAQCSMPQGLAQGQLQPDYGQQYMGWIEYTGNTSPYAPMAAGAMWYPFQQPMAQAYMPVAVDFNNVGARQQDARMQPFDPQCRQDHLQQHDALLVSDRPPIHCSRNTEQELVTEWSPRRQHHHILRFDPFEDHSVEEHRQAAVAVRRRGPVSPTSASAMSGLYTPCIDGIVDFTSQHAICSAHGDGKASLLPYTVDNFEYEMRKDVRQDSCTGGLPELGIHTWPTDQVKRADDIRSDSTGIRNMIDGVPIGCALGSSRIPPRMMRRRPPTKGGRRLERRVRFAKMNDPETGKGVEVVIEREADKYLDLLEYLTYRATERVKNKTSSKQDCDALPLLPLWLHFPDLLPAVLHTHKEDVSLLRLSGNRYWCESREDARLG